MDQSRLSQIFKEDMMRGMTRLQELKYQAVVILKPQDGPMEVMGDNHLCDYINRVSDLPFTDAVPRSECSLSNQTRITLTKPPYFERQNIGDKRRFLRQLVSSIISPQWKQEIPPDFWPPGFLYHDPSKGYTKDEIPVIVDHIYDYFNAISTNVDLDSSPSNGVESDISDGNSDRDEVSSPLSNNEQSSSPLNGLRDDILPSRKRRRVIRPPSGSDSDISNDDRGAERRRRVPFHQNAVGPITRTPEPTNPAPGPSTSNPPDGQCNREQDNKKARILSGLSESTKKHVTFLLQSQKDKRKKEGTKKQVTFLLQSQKNKKDK